jgi:hypothetical protein
MYADHDCLPSNVILWSDPGIIDIEIWMASYFHPAKMRVLWHYNVPATGKGYHDISLGQSILGGRMMHLYTRVRLRPDKKLGRIYYDPMVTSTRQTVNGLPFTKGLLGIKLIAPLS